MDTEMESISAEKKLLPSKILEASQDNQSFLNKKTDTQKKNSTLFSSYINYHPKDNQLDYIKNEKKKNYLNRPKREYPDFDGLYLLVRMASKNEAKDLDVFVRDHSRFCLRVSIEEYNEIKKKQNEKVKQLYKSYRDYFPKTKTRTTQCFEGITTDKWYDHDLQPEVKYQETDDIPSDMLDDSNDVDMIPTDAAKNSTTEISKGASVSQNVGSPIDTTLTVIDREDIGMEVDIENDQCLRPKETSTDAAKSNISNLCDINDDDCKNASDCKHMDNKKKKKYFSRKTYSAQQIRRRKRKKVYIADANVKEGYWLVPRKRSTDSVKSDEREIMSDDEHKDESLSRLKILTDATKNFFSSSVKITDSAKTSQDSAKTSQDCLSQDIVLDVDSFLNLPDKSDGSMVVDENVKDGYWLVPRKKSTDAATNSMSKTSKDCCLSQDIGLPNDESMSDDESIEGLGFGREAYILSKLSLKRSANWNWNQETGMIEQVANNPPQNEVSEKTLETLLMQDNEQSTEKLFKKENDKGSFKYKLERFMSDLNSQKEYTIQDISTVQETPELETPELETPELEAPEEEAPEEDPEEDPEEEDPEQDLLLSML